MNEEPDYDDETGYDIPYERDYDEPNFRCPGCEMNNGTGRYCPACLEEMERPR
jgi:hypothetical protein